MRNSRYEFWFMKDEDGRLYVQKGYAYVVGWEAGGDEARRVGFARLQSPWCD